jgi:hypothetical protein
VVIIAGGRPAPQLAPHHRHPGPGRRCAGAFFLWCSCGIGSSRCARIELKRPVAFPRI